MTEAASMITANPLDGPRKPGSAGRPAGTQVRVVQREGDEAAASAGAPAADSGAVRGLPARWSTGRVQIKGPGVITGYASGGRPGAFSADGWLDTGDLGHLDADGYLFLAGRADDVINRGGEKIYPREIEEFLLTQPGVRSVAVVGVRDDVLGEYPVAYVVPADPGPKAAGLPTPPGAVRAGRRRPGRCVARRVPGRPAQAHAARRLPPGRRAASGRDRQGGPQPPARASRGARLAGYRWCGPHDRGSRHRIVPIDRAQRQTRHGVRPGAASPSRAVQAADVGRASARSRASLACGAPGAARRLSASETTARATVTAAYRSGA